MKNGWYEITFQGREEIANLRKGKWFLLGHDTEIRPETVGERLEMEENANYRRLSKTNKKS